MTKAWTPIEFFNTHGHASLVLVCEHASARIPEDFYELRLTSDAAQSHAAWDIGALQLAERLARRLDAPLVSCGVSRAIYDCNRSISAPDSIPTKSECIAFPGNADLTSNRRRQRAKLIHDLFHNAVEQLIDTQLDRVGQPVAIVTIHSFTPVYFGQKREVEIGFLCHNNDVLCRALLNIERKKKRYKAEIDQPYAKTDGVTYTLEKHAEARNLHATMIEIRNDLIDSEGKIEPMATHLSDSISQALLTLCDIKGTL